MNPLHADTSEPWAGTANLSSAIRLGSDPRRHGRSDRVTFRRYLLQFALPAVVVAVIGGVTGRIFLIGCGLFALLVGGYVAFAGRRARSATYPAVWISGTDGQRISPTALPPLPARGFRWTGGCNVVSTMGGRLNATAPLAVLSAAPGWARLEVRPAILGRLFGFGGHSFQASSNTTVFPASSRLRTTGIGIQTPGEPPVYFWCSGRELILTALQGCGFHAEWRVVRVKM